MSHDREGPGRERPMRVSRRALFIGTAAIAAARAMPSRFVCETVAAPMAKPVLPAWIVGSPDEFDWQLVRAATSDDALRERVTDYTGMSACEPDRLEDECQCEFCYYTRAFEVERVPSFDAIAEPTPGDWIRSGSGHACSRCSYETFRDADGHGVGDEAVCEECMTLADWDIVDPEYAAELRADLEDDAPEPLS